MSNQDETSDMPHDVPTLRQPLEFSGFDATYYLARIRRRLSWRELFSEAPSWLVSMIVHAIILLLIATISMPLGKLQPGGHGTIALTIGFSDRDQTETGQTVTRQLDEQPTSDGEQATKDQGHAKQTIDDRAAARPVRQPPRVAQPAPQSEPTTAHDRRMSQYAQWFAQAKTVYRDMGKPSKYAAILNRGSATNRVATATRNLEPLTEVVDPAQRQLDKIVDNFIEYDIGNLRGRAGDAARNRFMALGPESIPALVRGLNKSAGIHASCPVGVIAGKLMHAISTSKDPSWRQYALDHVGVGVKESAPHYQRLMAMRKSWLKGDPLPPQVAKLLEDLESGPQGELVELMLALSDAPADLVVASLESGDDYLATAAVLAVIQSRSNWPANQRGKLVQALSLLRAQTKNDNLRELAGEGVQVMSRG